MPIHPTDRYLNRFADRDLPPGWQSIVARHLERCVRCRSRVMAVRTLSREARALGAPPLPPGLRRRVLAAAASGPAPIIPLADPRPRGRRWQQLAWMGAGMVTVAVALRVLLVPDVLRSEASALDFAPAQPAAGAAVEVTYHATPRLSGEERLRLRARFRRADGPPSGAAIRQVEAAVLLRNGDGTFRGTVQLPADVVYAAFAVEDLRGTRVDGRGRLGFELPTYADGLPSYEALVQRAYEAVGRDLGAALAAMTEATERYPDRVEAWNYRHALEVEELDPAAEDSVWGEYLRKLQAFDADLRDRPVPPAVAGSMYGFARRLQAAGVAERWRTRLLAEAPGSAVGVELRAIEIAQRGRDDPAGALAAFEALWIEGVPNSQVVAERAYDVARAAGHDAATLRWAARLVHREPSLRLHVARELIAVPALTDSVLAWLEQECAALDGVDDARRPLDRTAAAQRRAEQRARREVMGLMGRARLAAGDAHAGLALLDSATAQGWSLPLFAALADARLAAGDVPAGVAALARLAVDPGYAGPDPATRALALVAPEEWERAKRGAEDRMLAETWDEADPAALPPSVRVTDADGTERELRGLLAGRITAVAVFWPGCRTCYTDLRRLEQSVDGLPQSVGALLVATTEISAGPLAALRAAGVSLPVLVDAYGEFTEAVNSWGTTEYYLVDSRGVVRFGDTTLDDVPRQVRALQREGAAAGIAATDVTVPAGAPDANAVVGSR